MTSPKILTTIRDIRPARTAEHPRVSVVMTSTHAADGMVDRPDTSGQQDMTVVESLLVCPPGVADAIRGAASRRGIRMLVAPWGSSVKDMRALGVLSAKGDVIVILGEDDTFDSARLQVLMSAMPRRAEANALRRNH